MDLKKLMKTSDSIGLAVLRVVTGAIFMAHGLPKLGLMGDGSLAATTESFDSVGIPLPAISALIVGIVEAVGGALLIAGLMTRVVTATQTIAMLVAVLAVHLPNGFAGPGGYQWALLLGAAAFCLMLEGAGKYSVDRKLSSS